MQPKFIFKVKSFGISYLGDVSLVVPRTLAKTAKLSWSIAGLEIRTSDTSFSVAFPDGSKNVCNDCILIPWQETAFCLMKEECIFAEVSMTLTSDEKEWGEFKEHIADEAECFVAEIYDLDSELHRCTSTGCIPSVSYDLTDSSIHTLEKYYKEGRVSHSLYNEMISKWRNLKFITACRITSYTPYHEKLSDDILHDILDFLINYTRSKELQ